MTLDILASIDWNHWISFGVLLFILFVALPWIGKHFS